MTLPPSGTLPTSREGGRNAVFKLLALYWPSLQPGKGRGWNKWSIK
jgi:hypothetical protein